MKCPIHDVDLYPCETHYGTRWGCPTEGCTVVKWSGSTSTPADLETRTARIAAHEHFDKLWRSGKFKRQKLYSRLAKFMGLSKKKTHIGHFNIEQCNQVIQFCEGLEKDDEV